MHRSTAMRRFVAVLAMTVSSVVMVVPVGGVAGAATSADLPAAPTILRNATATDRAATVSWVAPTSLGGSPLTGYVVTPYVGYFPLPARRFDSTATTQTVTGLKNGVTYRFRVQAFNAAGTGPHSKVTNPVTPKPTFFVVFDGQSLNILPLGSNYPSQLMASHPGIPYRIVAIVGTSWTELALTAPERTYSLANAGHTTILVMNGGTSDLKREGDSGATLYADEKAYADKARAAGFDYVISTTTTPAKGFSADQEASRLGANALVVGNADGVFDYTINFDVDLSPELSLDDPFDLAAYPDGVHWSTSAAGVAADLVDRALALILAG